MKWEKSSGRNKFHSVTSSLQAPRRRSGRDRLRYATGVVVEAVESRILFAVNPSVVDLLVAYTPQALQAVGSQAKMVNKIDRAIADVDQTLSNSEVNVSYRIVDIMETAYNDTANTQTDFAAELGPQEHQL